MSAAPENVVESAAATHPDTGGKDNSWTIQITSHLPLCRFRVTQHVYRIEELEDVFESLQRYKRVPSNFKAYLPDGIRIEIKEGQFKGTYEDMRELHNTRPTVSSGSILDSIKHIHLHEKPSAGTNHSPQVGPPSNALSVPTPPPFLDPPPSMPPYPVGHIPRPLLWELSPGAENIPASQSRLEKPPAGTDVIPVVKSPYGTLGEPSSSLAAPSAARTRVPAHYRLLVTCSTFPDLPPIDINCRRFPSARDLLVVFKKAVSDSLGAHHASMVQQWLDSPSFPLGLTFRYGARGGAWSHLYTDFEDIALHHEIRDINETKLAYVNHIMNVPIHILPSPYLENYAARRNDPTLQKAQENVIVHEPHQSDIIGRFGSPEPPVSTEEPIPTFVPPEKISVPISQSSESLKKPYGDNSWRSDLLHTLHLVRSPPADSARTKKATDRMGDKAIPYQAKNVPMKGFYPDMLKEEIQAKWKERQQKAGKCELPPLGVTLDRSGRLPNPELRDRRTYVSGDNKTGGNDFENLQSHPPFGYGGWPYDMTLGEYVRERQKEASPKPSTRRFGNKEVDDLPDARPSTPPFKAKALPGIDTPSYLAELAADPANSTSSKRLLEIMKEEDIHPVSTLGLKLLDLAKDLKVKETVVQPIQTPVPEVEQPSMNSALEPIEDRLNDFAAMLNVIAEAVGIDLLENDEEKRKQVSVLPSSPPLPKLEYTGTETPLSAFAEIKNTEKEVNKVIQNLPSSPDSVTSPSPPSRKLEKNSLISVLQAAEQLCPQSPSPTQTMDIQPNVIPDFTATRPHPYYNPMPRNPMPVHAWAPPAGDAAATPHTSFLPHVLPRNPHVPIMNQPLASLGSPSPLWVPMPNAPNGNAWNGLPGTFSGIPHASMRGGGSGHQAPYSVPSEIAHQTAVIYQQAGYQNRYHPYGSFTPDEQAYPGMFYPSRPDQRSW